MKQWYYNNPYMYLIIHNNQLPVFLEKGQVFIPVFSEYEYAINFKENYLPSKKSKVLCIDMNKGMRFLEQILIKNKYIPNIGIYNTILTCINSKEFIESFYQYKQTYIDTLNKLLSEGVSINEDTILEILSNSFFYVLVKDTSSSKDGYYKLLKNEDKEVIGLQYASDKENINIIKHNDKIVVFTSEKEFLKYKNEYNSSNVGIKKCWGFQELFSNITYDEYIPDILVNPYGICQTINCTDYIA